MSGTNQENMLILLSGADRVTLLARIDRLLNRLSSGLEIPANEMASQRGQAERLAIVSPRAELEDRLKTARNRLAGLTRKRLVLRDRGIFFGSDETAGRVAFLFPGQGSQHVGMLGQLYEKVPIVRTWFDSLDEAHVRKGETPPARLIFPPEEMGPDERRVLERDLFDIGRGAQLGTAANLALYEVLTLLGIKADVVLGHSNGEHSAVLAACLDVGANREPICNWLCEASRAGRQLSQPESAEKMVAVAGVAREHLENAVAQFPGELFLAMDNCPHQQVLAGRQAAIDQTVKEMSGGGGFFGDLPFTRAYHTPLFSDWAQTLRSYYEKLPLDVARVPIFSCLTCSAIPLFPAAIRDNMAAQWTSSVRFREAVEALYAEGVRAFIEVGPGSKLTAFVEDTLRGRPHLAASTSSAHRDDLSQLQLLLAALHAHGVAVDAQRFEALGSNSLYKVTPDIATVAGNTKLPETIPVAGLPVEVARAASSHSNLIADARSSLARMEKMFRAIVHSAPGGMPPISSPISGPISSSISSPISEPINNSPLLGGVVEVSADKLIAERRFSLAGDPFVADHSLGRRTPGVGWAQFPLAVLPLTASLEIMAEAAHALTGKRVAALTGVRANRWLALDGGSLTVRVESRQRGSAIHVALFESPSSAPGPAFEGTVRVGSKASEPSLDLTADLTARPPERWTAEEFYRRYAFHGPSFQGISRVVALSAQSIEAELQVTALPGLNAEDLHSDPALLDCAGQMVAFWLLEHGRREPTFGIFPFAVKRVILRHRFLPADQKVYCRAVINSASEVKTEASFIFSTPDGRVVAEIEGFEQRLIEFPQALARWIFGGEAAEFSHPAEGPPDCVVRRIALSDWPLLAESWGIWQRALAHLVSSEEELAAWLALPQNSDRRLQSLLEMIVAKETVRRWAAQRRFTAPDFTDIVIGEDRQIICRSLGADLPHFELRHEGGLIIAAAR
jgi:acyl transferase domain-containing protein